jgi:DNA-directed RNA polymerase specialized sigma24 family protein
MQDYRSPESFSDFFERTEPPLRRALVATYGPERGRDATAEALAWAWEHRDRLAGIEHPLGYLYRVGQSRARRRLGRVPFVRGEWREPHVEPGLLPALRGLPERQRVAVVLVHGLGWTLAEVGDLLGVAVSTVQTHLERGLAGLRRRMEVEP